MTTARGLRNNNPGNIVKSAIAWQGKVDNPDEARFETFDTPENGLRALCKLLLTYQNKYNLRTVSGIILRWAPPVENDTGAYVAAVAKALGVGADDAITLNDPAILSRLCAAIVQHENGQQPYPAAMITAAANAALGLPNAVAPASPAPPAPALPQTPITGVVSPPAPAPAAPPIPAVLKPRPKMAAEELTDIPAAELDRLVAQFKAGGASVSVSTQANGLYRVLATY